MKPKLFESLMQQRDGEFKDHVDHMRYKATVHPFLKRYLDMGVREGLFSDAASALGRLHDTLASCLIPDDKPKHHNSATYDSIDGTFS
jgi:hypothetical protein